jgi:hypothetical protein
VTYADHIIGDRGCESVADRDSLFRRTVSPPSRARDRPVDPAGGTGAPSANSRTGTNNRSANGGTRNAGHACNGSTNGPGSIAPAAPAPAALSPAPAARLVGIAAWNALIGNSITGSDDGKPLTEYYAPDGTAKSMSGNEISQGTWALAGEIVCFKYSDEPTPECYKIEVVGDTLTYFDEKGSGTRFKILKGNPSNL